MRRSAADIVREYGPFPGVDCVNGVTFDGERVWFATGGALQAFDPASGQTQRSLDVAAHAGTAFDGRHLFQLAEDRIHKIDPRTGHVLGSIPAPGGGGDSGLAWAEGTLWVGQYRERKIHQVDPETGAILRTIESNRFVTGVTWVEGRALARYWEGDTSDVRRIDPRSRRGPREPRDAARRRRVRARVRWRRSLLLRRARAARCGPSVARSGRRRRNALASGLRSSSRPP
jgi:outer membrane protein assembly factor BamB